MKQAVEYYYLEQDVSKRRSGSSMPWGGVRPLADIRQRARPGMTTNRTLPGLRFLPLLHLASTLQFSYGSGKITWTFSMVFMVIATTPWMIE